MIFLPLILSSGCVSVEKAQQALKVCPQYFQDNIGEAATEPLSPLGVVLRGRVTYDESRCPIHLYGLFDKNIVWHEAFHSFEMRAHLNRHDEWELFQYDFGDDIYIGPVVVATMLFVPFVEQAPIPGRVRLYSSLSKLEDSADCFMYWMQCRQGKKVRNDVVLQRKLIAVEKFVTGQYNGDYVGEK